MRIYLEESVDNASLQVGDIAYYVPNLDAYNQGAAPFVSWSDPQLIGPISAIGPDFIDIPGYPTDVPEEAFLAFRKDDRVNNSSLKGYFAEITMINDLTTPIELFALNSEISLSSK